MPTDPNTPQADVQAVERLIQKADSWDRCYPGNLNIEQLVRDLTDALATVNAEIARLTAERYRLAYVVCGGEDCPGLLDATSVDALEEIAKKERSAHGETINSLLKAEAEREAALAQVAAAQIEMRERAAEVSLHWLRKYPTAETRKSIALSIRTLEPNPDAQAALQRALEAERQACADAAWDARLRYPATEQDFGRVNARRDILARGNSSPDDNFEDVLDVIARVRDEFNQKHREALNQVELWAAQGDLKEVSHASSDAERHGASVMAASQRGNSKEGR